MQYRLIKVNEKENESTHDSSKSSKSRGKSLVVFPENYVVLDIETTGLSPQVNEIIELSALKIENGSITQEFNSLVKPATKISPFISNLTGITDSLVANAPHIKDAIKDFNDFCDGQIILGHNVTFDINFITTKLHKYHQVEFSNDYIDTLRIARLLLPQLPNKKLGTIARHFQFNTDGMHRGLKDCKVTNLCFCKFKEIALEKYGSLDNILK